MAWPRAVCVLFGTPAPSSIYLTLLLHEISSICRHIGDDLQIGSRYLVGAYENAHEGAYGKLICWCADTGELLGTIRKAFRGPVRIMQEVVNVFEVP